MAMGASRIKRLPAERVGAGASAGTGARLAQHADLHTLVAKEQVSSAGGQVEVNGESQPPQR